LGKILAGQYAVYDRLGRGGMGAVYKGLHLGLRRHVAIKTILPDPNPARLAEHRLRFEREARILSEMRHQGIVAVYDYGEDCGMLYMVLEFLDGESLYELLRHRGRLPISHAVPIARALLEALEEPHIRGLIHRDIKPSNVMIEARGGRERVVLIDFGIAKVTEEDDHTPKTRTGVFVGTPKYMAPEQLGTGEMGPWTDYYALGVLLYRMLTGSTPFRGSRGEVVASQLRDPVPPLPAELGLAPFDAVIGRAMAKKPADRFPDAQTFLENLSNAWVECAGASEERNATAPMPVLRPDVIVPEAHRMTTVKRASDILPDAYSRTTIQRADTINGPISETSETTRSAMSGALELSAPNRGAKRRLEIILAVAAIALAAYVGQLWLAPSTSGQGENGGVRAASQALPPPLPPIPATSTDNPARVEGSGGRNDSNALSAGTPSNDPASKNTDTRTLGATAGPGATTAQQQVAPPATKSLAEGKPATPARPVKKVKAATTKSTSRSQRRRARRAARKKSRASTKRTADSPERFIREFRAALKACKCERAKSRIQSLERLNSPAVPSLRSKYQVACMVTGVGCNKQ